ncbi:MAG: hypothetical protein OXG82_02870 [Gammaproteobacteria bacterium]|nr:hypothetical protein [Gammaproteobacteria bacterium]
MVTRHLPGDILLRRKGLVLHKGIALGNGRVFHNTPLDGEHVSTEESFRAGHRMYVKRLRTDERRRTVRAARTENPRRYNLLTNNCEHTVTRARTGEASSRQLEAWAAGLGLGALAFAVTRRPSLAVAGFALGASVGPRAIELVRRSVRDTVDD